MLFGRRRVQASRQAPQVAQVQEVSSNKDRVEKVLIDTLRLMSSSIDELKREVDKLKKSQRELNSRLEDSDAKRLRLESEYNKMITKPKNFDSIPAEPNLETNNILQQSKDAGEPLSEAKNGPDIHREINNVRLMPGVGFSSVTPEYLKSLKR